ncbi:diaminopimelate epimerase [Conexibacter stalactiti]|uniref:Diaminopimelate epimerase n=1 Tax=Conexibacter stalactiti TaxID=1940611 RepID=A0ABU4HV38_9ACTN|nr:diaminopimelate epimerase [Conexibacter stalactiti]MDW5597131.1 diaminopimelate epimerase [Conexibacter stalactiti]MEC5037773.1 diaminopimelate epimerase [Conexibacter stalactiti]
MKFEKWQALGNDYAIVEADALPFELTPARIRAFCAAHFGVFADGILLLSRSDEPGYVASLKIFNPDGSEAELSGNGAREAIMYLRQRGWVDSDEFSIMTAAGEIRPSITGPTTCKVDMGRAKLTSKDFPSGPADGAAELTADGTTWSFQHVSIGNPQCSIRVDSVEALEALDLPAIGGALEHHELFPNRTNVSWYAELAPDRIRARIFERGVGETLSSGTGATGAAVAHVLRGGGGDDPDLSTVTVVLDGGDLEVEVAEDLHVNLTGWAVPVFAAELSENFLKELHETE